MMISDQQNKLEGFEAFSWIIPLTPLKTFRLSFQTIKAKSCSSNVPSTQTLLKSKQKHPTPGQYVDVPIKTRANPIVDSENKK